MPRKGKGQKTQTATGQQYGQAKMQEESQGVVALPKMEEPQIPRMRPGESAFNRPTERPSEPVATGGIPNEVVPPEVTIERRMRIMAALPALEAMASEPFANPKLRNAVRKMRAFVGNTEDFINRDQ